MGFDPYALPLRTGYTYHIYNRGNNRELLFRQPWDYRHFLRKYKEHIDPLVRTYAYALLPNHFHFMFQVRSYQELHAALPQKFPSANSIGGIQFAEEALEEDQLDFDEVVSAQLSRRFASFFSGFARVINNVHNRRDKLLALPFKRIQVRDEAYFTNLICYLHRNPIHHGFCLEYSDWPYTSFQEILDDRSILVETRSVLEWFGSADIFLQAHINYRDGFFEERYNVEYLQQYKHGARREVIDVGFRE